MGNPLFGRTIAVTRPAAQAEGLCRAIEETGGKAFRFPLLEIIPVTEPAVFASVAERLDTFAIAFFVSPNAVEHGLNGLRQIRAWPLGLRVAAVGRGSARALEKQGFGEVLVPAEGADSEAVLALPAFAADAVRGAGVLVVRGDTGRELLGETLAKRGARVEYLSCYQRRCPAADTAPLLERARGGSLDAIFITSSEAADHLARLLGGEGLACLSSVPIFVSHPRIAERCHSHGLMQTVVAGAGDDALLHALVAFFG
ncbi:MAG: uroporphyrinogen-III synthase [Azoarcus sp.]|nr:uroporphyrinogen-III synthase [Azoarcus sp.]